MVRQLWEDLDKSLTRARFLVRNQAAEADPVQYQAPVAPETWDHRAEQAHQAAQGPRVEPAAINLLYLSYHTAD